MKTYEVSFKYETWANYTVEATNQAEAEKLGYEMLQRDEGDYLHTGEWTDKIVEDITPTPRPLTPDELAFMSAYQSNVADAPPDIVEAFIRAEDGDSFCKQYGNEYYTGLADAWGVWEEAMDYARGNK